MSRTVGDNAQFNEPRGIALDEAGDTYVANNVGNTYRGSVVVFAPGASRNATPTAVIGGSNAALNGPTGIVLDPAGRIYVANCVINAITVYAAGASGNASPIATIQGSSTGLGCPAFIGF